MTLALILFLYAFSSGPTPDATAAPIQPSQQTAPEVKPADSSTPTPQNNANPPQNNTNNDVRQPPPTAPSQNPSSSPKKSPAPAKRKRPGTAKDSAPCGTSTANKAPSAPNPSNPPEASGSAPMGTSPVADRPPCAPTKVVVREGGTSEGTVQLNGGDSSGQQSPRRAGTNRLLASTEESLKKIEALPLDSAQQGTVKQIRQYMAQARASLAAGDVDLAHNVAVKAHLLADELLKSRT
jgi:hypothetical protein